MHKTLRIIVICSFIFFATSSNAAETVKMDSTDSLLVLDSAKRINNFLIFDMATPYEDQGYKSTLIDRWITLCDKNLYGRISRGYIPKHDFSSEDYGFINSVDFFQSLKLSTYDKADSNKTLNKYKKLWCKGLRDSDEKIDVLISKDNKIAHTIRINSIKMNSSRVEFWSIGYPKKREKVSYVDSDGKSILILDENKIPRERDVISNNPSFKDQLTVDCNSKKLATSSSIRFNEFGEVTDSKTYQYKNYESMAPDSVGEVLIESVCELANLK